MDASYFLLCCRVDVRGLLVGESKNMRLMILARNIKNEFKRMLHPRAVLPVRVNRQVISPSIIASVNTFFVFICLCFGRMDTTDVFRGGAD